MRQPMYTYGWYNTHTHLSYIHTDVGNIPYKIRPTKTRCRRVLPLGMRMPPGNNLLDPRGPGHPVHILKSLCVCVCVCVCRCVCLKGLSPVILHGNLLGPWLLGMYYWIYLHMYICVHAYIYTHTHIYIYGALTFENVVVCMLGRWLLEFVMIFIGNMLGLWLLSM